jgi:hypothetical protein
MILFYMLHKYRVLQVEQRVNVKLKTVQAEALSPTLHSFRDGAAKVEQLIYTPLSGLVFYFFL